MSAWRIVFEQDLPAVEQMQIGRGLAGCDGGVFSPAMDAATHHFPTAGSPIRLTVEHISLT